MDNEIDKTEEKQSESIPKKRVKRQMR